MKMSDAMEIITKKKKPTGFRVSFEKVRGSMLESDYFPEGDEPLIKTEKKAWDLAGKFAAGTVNRCINIYVVDNNYSPVGGYRDKMIRNRE